LDEEFGPLFYEDYGRSKQYQGLILFGSDASMLGKSLDGSSSSKLALEASQLIPFLKNEDAIYYEGIVIASRFSSLDPDILKQLSLVHFDEMSVYSMDLFYEKFWFRTPLTLIGSEWPFEVNFLLVQNSIYSALKRSWDFLLALTALVLLSPLFLILSLAIKIFDGAPVFYSQQRVGIYEKPFTLYKFRTMVQGSDHGDRYTREGDLRVTMLGAFLRKTRLDELPQLWNVLRGEMSIIGPRAEWVKLVAEYNEKIPHFHLRHLVRPGITGWAQVNYPYGASLDDARQKLSYDLYYIKNFSMRLDAEVTLKTFYVIFFGKGR
jgi:lipopolysaccharide/colanic/teichoic acid biosynthesis glycosyltransferase